MPFMVIFLVSQKSIEERRYDFMSRTGENIHKRKDGRWEARYKKGKKSNGKTLYGSIYGKTYREVKEKVKSVTMDEECDRRKSAMTFQDVYKQWLKNNEMKQKKATQYRYAYLIEKHLLPAFGKQDIKEMSALKINAFLQEKMQRGSFNHDALSPAYVRSMGVLLQSVMKFAVQEEYCRPLKSEIIKPSIKQNDLQVLTTIQQQRLEHYLLEHMDPVHMGIFLSLHMGLRIGEICALQWTDIDLENRVLHVRHTTARVLNKDAKTTEWIIDLPKTKASKRTIPISDKLNTLLWELKQKSLSEYVVSDQRTFINPRVFSYRYHKVCKICDLKKIHFHTLRHTFATRCIAVGMDVKSLSELLGHSNVSITLNTYVHPSMDQKRSQMEKLFN